MNEYWKSAKNEFKSIKSIALAAILAALAIVVEQFNIRLSPTLEVSLSFIPISICSAITGPLMAIACGIIVDIVGAVIGGYVPFFFGYTLTAVLTAVVYALFLYRSNMSFARIALSKLVVNIPINVFLGSVWRVVLQGDFYLYYVAISAVKNVALFPCEVALMHLFFTALAKPLEKFGIKKTVFGKKEKIALVVFFAVGVVAILAFIKYYDIIKQSLSALK